jgi:hypothetical protein
MAGVSKTFPAKSGGRSRETRQGVYRIPKEVIRQGTYLEIKISSDCCGLAHREAAWISPPAVAPARSNQLQKTERKIMKIDIAIVDDKADASDEYTVTYNVMDTNAPVDYDGFGTFTLAEYGEFRTVMIREEHFGWQTARFSSGNKWSRPTEHDRKDIIQALWKRLEGRKE